MLKSSLSTNEVLSKIVYELKKKTKKQSEMKLTQTKQCCKDWECNFFYPTKKTKTKTMTV